MSTPKEQLQRIAEKAKVLSIPENLGLAKSFLILEEKIDAIPETDLTAIQDQLKNIEEKLDEEEIIELQII